MPRTIAEHLHARDGASHTARRLTDEGLRDNAPEIMRLAGGEALMRQGLAEPLRTLRDVPRTGEGRALAALLLGVLALRLVIAPSPGMFTEDPGESHSRTLVALLRDEGPI